jgi:hypothetical protein
MSSTILGNGKPASGSGVRVGREAQLSYPQGHGVSYERSRGFIIVADTGSDRLLRIDKETKRQRDKETLRQEEFKLDFS